MKRLNPVTALFSRSAMTFKPSHATRVPLPALQAKEASLNAAPSKPVGYIDGYTYRKLASPTQVTIAIQDFFQEFVGQDDCTDEVMDYVQQWNQGRSLRSIRDEIARGPRARCWR